MAIIVKIGENLLAERLIAAQDAEIRMEQQLTDSELEIISQGQQITELELFVLENLG